ncbi:unnamed protein product [Ranitomeya imitator]|uniref:Reverse transcriptase domain-containing protein n=1 Tax=Ranitomeya imitator TaxID=111125 RepID=A0ABN9M1V8_9NEOB|nr:unnamed protein product [Ranitomeya imitator]
MDLLDENDTGVIRKRFSGRIPSQATPSLSLFPAVQIFFNHICRDIQTLRVDGNKNRNLSPLEQRALVGLQNNKEFLVREVDKGGNIVLWPNSLYLQEVERQLGDSSCYRRLPADPTDIFKGKLDHLFEQAFRHGILNKKEVTFLTTDHPVVPTFYLLPKVHKSLENPPGRPIVSGISGLFEKPCTYLDFFLQPMAMSLKSFIRDSSHLIQLLQDFALPSGTLLITLDVESLYTSINHDMGLKAVSFFLEHNSTGDRGHDQFILDLLFFVLDKNYFVFDGTFYRQVKGTAMGARCAPSYANLFLGWWEESVVFEHGAFKAHCKKWLRFIDDVIMFWTGTEEDYHLFLADLNNNLLNIRLTSHLSRTSVEFLDLKIILDGSYIATTLFRKPTATNSLLHYSSFHPRHLKNGIPTGQFLRLRRNCSATADFNMEARKLTDRFKHRGYPKAIISSAYQRAKTSARSDLFHRQTRESSRPLGIVTTFNNQWGDVYKILDRSWGILLSEPKLKPHISDTPKLIARRARNLKDLLCHSHFVRPTTRLNRGIRTFGTYPCGSCNICQFTIAQDGLLLSIFPFQIKSRRFFFNCKSRSLVYALICDCPKVYVGQTTQQLRRRVQQHLSNIATAQKDRERGKNVSAVATHFLDVHHGRTRGLKVMGLEMVPLNIRGGDRVKKLLRCESRWIHDLRSLAPHGLNEELLFSGYYKQT